MKSSTVFTALTAFFAQASASAIPDTRSPITPRQTTTASCANSATSRSCWGAYSIDTNWYNVTPTTGVTRGIQNHDLTWYISTNLYTEYWLSVENSTITPDGYTRHAMTFNGTLPGPAITADWGDNLVIRMFPVPPRVSPSPVMSRVKMFFRTTYINHGPQMLPTIFNTMEHRFIGTVSVN